ncbi:MAG: radical SAM protein, partial [Sulfurimonadaceae bacterium]|nr:radical SAM protein [Sulfurimonadaceae bacterium]
YGQGEGRSIASLTKKMSLIRGVRRIRIGSLEPIQITDEFMEILDEPWLERHLHIAIQHSSQQMLKIMNRRNRIENDIKLFNELAERGFALGTDFVVGHPGETEAIWEEAVANLKRLSLTHVHAFTYSKRDGTPSATMKPEVPGNISKQRMQELNAIVEANNLAFREAHRVPLDVLVESEKDGLYSGLDQYFNKVVIKSDEDLTGNWVTVENYQIEREYNYVEL